MSIRPRDPRLARVARAGQRMAPGGRRWSESPIPRVGVRRVRMVGATPAGLVALDDGEWEVRNSVGSPPYTQTAVLDIATGSSWVPADGEGVVVLMHGIGLGTITIPSGWTLVDEGTAGAIQWLCMFLVGDGTAVDQDVTFSTIPNDTPVCYSYWSFSGASGWEAAIAGATSDTAVADYDSAIDFGSLVSPWNVTIAQYSDEAFTAAPTESVVDGATDPHVDVWTDGYGYGSWWMGINGLGVGLGAAPAVADAAYSAPEVADWWSACFGWVRA